MVTRRKAFTIIEIMLVVGVLVILIGIVVWALKGAGEGGAAKSTGTTLQNLTGMSEEFNRKTKLSVFEGPAPAIYPFNPTLKAFCEIAPGNVSTESQNNDRFNLAVWHSAQVIARLSSIPDNKRILEKIPADQMMRFTFSGQDGAVLLDGWKNPILYVPAGGLAFVTAKDGAASTVSNGTNYTRGARVIAPSSTLSGKMVYWTAINATSTAPPSADWFEGIRSPDGRPFWASAGSDGAFGFPESGPGKVKTLGNGDDNIYSFEQ